MESFPGLRRKRRSPNRYFLLPSPCHEQSSWRFSVVLPVPKDD